MIRHQKLSCLQSYFSYLDVYAQNIISMKYLAIGPGGVGLFGLLGALEPFYDKVDEISGASAGAILAFLWGVGCSYEQSIRICISIDLKELSRFNILNMVDSFGIIDHQPIKRVLLNVTQNKDLTLADIDKVIHIAVFNMNKMKTIYISKYTHPTLSIIDAVCMSISVPFIFKPFVYQDEYYIDGGCAETAPLGPFLLHHAEDVFILQLARENGYSNIKTLFDFMKCIGSIILQNRLDWSTIFNNIIIIPTGDINIMDFDITDEDKVRLMLNGKKCT